MAEELSADFIENIHDILVDSFLPFDEKVGPAEHRDRALIESAAARPHHIVFGEEVWPTLSQKAAALFHSLTCNHCFLNGNKRTAVIGLDMFLVANERLLLLSYRQVYELAKTTAKANEQGRTLDSVMQELANMIGLSSVDTRVIQNASFKEDAGKDYDRLVARVEELSHLREWILDRLRHSN